MPLPKSPAGKEHAAADTTAPAPARRLDPRTGAKDSRDPGTPRVATRGADRQPSLPSLPPRLPVIGVGVSPTTYDEAAACILAAARRRAPFLVAALPVHGLIEARRLPAMTAAIAGFDIVCPDGQPVRHALNLLHKAGLTDRVYGPTLMLKLCEGAAAEGLPVYLYGSTPAVIAALSANLTRRFPNLRIAGAESPPFRPLSAGESAETAARMRDSGAALVFIGLGCPRQEIFAAAQRDRIGLPLICVGAAFDFHAGTKKQAPRWMQDHALEWLFRLSQEPRRLFGRYASTNFAFLVALAGQWARQRVGGN